MAQAVQAQNGRRLVWLMLPAGAITDQTLLALVRYSPIQFPTFHQAHNMRQTLQCLTKLLTLCSCLALSHAAWADFELAGPDGQRYQLKDDGTWRRIDGKGEPKAQQQGEAVLRLEEKIERGRDCRLVFSLTNNLPYEIQNIVPYFSVYRSNGILHETASVAFQSIRPIDKIRGVADFTKINCADIARVQVSGGDRCEMRELTKFSDANGQCLARVRVLPSELARFDK